MRLLALSDQLQHDSYYQAASQPVERHLALRGLARVDVCVVGGGISGLTAARELAMRGRRVMLLEAMRIGWGASGRNGGQVLSGFSCGWNTLQRQLGGLAASELWQMTREALQQLRDDVERHGIVCELRDGAISVALTPRRALLLRREFDALQQHVLGDSLHWLEQDALGAQIGSALPRVGLLDTAAAQLNPLRYVRGLADAAQRAGVVVHEHSEVLELHPARDIGGRCRLRTVHGEVHCDAVLLAGGANLGRLAPQLARRVLPLATYQLASSPLAPELAAALLPGGCAVHDNEPELHYFRMSADGRLLFGGYTSGSSDWARGARDHLQRSMLRWFPQFDGVGIDHCWGGLLDVSWNQAPDFGRLAPNVFYLQGYSGHGLALGSLGGRLAAAAICGHSEGFDLMARLRHRSFPAIDGLRQPLLQAGRVWTRLREWL